MEESRQPEPVAPAAEQLELLSRIGAEVPLEAPLEELRQYCVFRAGRERFCFSVLDVDEVVEWPRLTRIPLAPNFLMGIFNLRGAIIPVVDIAVTEGRRSDLLPKHVVVASLAATGPADSLRIGIAADEVIGTYTTAEPLVLEGVPRDMHHCCGLLRHDDRLALALDLKKLTEMFPVPVI